MQSKVIFLVFSLFFIFQQNTKAQDEKLPSSFLIAIEQDNVFGFYPSAFGSIGLNDKISFAYYGLFWTNPSWGSIGSSDLLLEVGGGISYPYKNWLLNAYLGFTNGKLYSPNKTGQIGESIVPNFFLFYFGEKFEAEFFAGHYKGIRSKNYAFDNSIIWFYPGYKFSDQFTAGLHYENLSGGNVAFYRHFGPFVKFTIDNKYSFRFVAGKNFIDNFYSDEYYKLSVNLILK